MGNPGDDLKSRTKKFALEVIKLVEAMPRTPTVNVLGRQALRSATSVGANYRAACRSQSRAAFIAKMSIVIEECDETQYWLELMKDMRLIDNAVFDRLYDEADQLVAIFVASKITAKSNKK
jgi:four helix bundle protein